MTFFKHKSKTIKTRDSKFGMWLFIQQINILADSCICSTTTVGYLVIKQFHTSSRFYYCVCHSHCCALHYVHCTLLFLTKGRKKTPSERSNKSSVERYKATATSNKQQNIYYINQLEGARHLHANA